MNEPKRNGKGGEAPSISHGQPSGTGGRSASLLAQTTASTGGSTHVESNVISTIGIAAACSIAVVAFVFAAVQATVPSPQSLQLSDATLTSEIANNVVAQIKSALDVKLDTHIDTIDRKLGSVDKSIEDLRSRIDDQEGRFGDNVNRTDALASRVERLTELISLTASNSEKEVQRLSARITQLELNAGNKASAVNWASKMLGASIDHASTSLGIGRNHVNLWLSWFADQMGGRWSESVRVSWPPEVILEPDLATPGRCFCFEGNSGHMALQLPYEIEVNAVVLEHPMAAIAVEPGSVPRDVNISGAHGSMKRVEFPYEGGSMWVDLPTPQQMSKIHVKVESNWGGAFTCLYGVRVFGKRVV
eukprot:gnl/MRDRNA2_/MRDRNA2_299516_c0_seq1.p1 gnl/MRDRNA2_/MRDRNA2_299516_c0~~gnl/MRDRNA2_/MRDRNA2_299516_c0_seq1.p1  ORF type:complete len:361 (-),score=55.07 gnl/MRDRNA2_/MRDRNA2_299516_c0_seq1:26-1108(-)